MVIATRTSLLSQSAVATPGPSVTDWNLVDAEFRTVRLLVHLRLSSGEISPGEAGNTFSITEALLKAHLERFEVSDQPESSQALTHRSRRLLHIAHGGSHTSLTEALTHRSRRLLHIAHGGSYTSLTEALTHRSRRLLHIAHGGSYTSLTEALTHRSRRLLHIAHGGSYTSLTEGRETC